MRKSSRGNPWHDARGRFCSGPRANGTISTREVEKVDLQPGDKVNLKLNSGDSIFHSDSENIAGKREYKQSLSVDKDKVTLHTKVTLNGEESERSDVFHMSYAEFKDFLAATKTRRNEKGEVTWEFDTDSVNIYDDSALKDSLYGDDDPTCLNVEFNGDELKFKVTTDYDTVDKGTIRRDGEDFIIERSSRKTKVRSNYASHAEIEEIFRIKDMCDKWE